MKKTPYEIARKRAERGYTWLRTKGAKYGLDVDQVDPNYLDMGSSVWCVLGQASSPARTFNRVVNQVWPITFIRKYAVVWYGFNIKCSGSWLNHTDRRGVSTRDLKRAWTDVITEARAKEKELADV